MRRVLKPGGRIFVQENDVSLQRYDPPAPLVEKMWVLVAQLQKTLGGNALIGSNLHGLLTGAGFKDVALSFGPEVYSSGTRGFKTWIENQIQIFRGCADDLAKHQLATPQDTESVVSELIAFLDRPHAASWFAWNRASSRK